ncbi:MAG TPA: TetR/AcrR family transcriptional regulator [Candidatus Bariatricus faecipullorum]|nr:TetR/AcrR family transcriptional regulator [Candidatus Bariatricus faecipullorum]
MANSEKYDKILDALQVLLENKKMQSISVSEIAQTAGMGKGSIYYYFPSKDAILDALIVRTYEKPVQTARNLARETDISPFTRMAMIFQACRNSSSAFLKSEGNATEGAREKAFLHQRYLHYMISGLKPSLAEIIRQGTRTGDIHFDYPDALAEIVLLVLTVKLDNTLVPSTREETEYTIRALVALLEKGTENPAGSLDFLMTR